MSIITNRTHQVKLYGAVLMLSALILVVLAVTMAGGAQAQDGPRTGDNAVEYSAPFPCSEEAVPDASTVGIVRQGYYAVFDAFWDYEVGHLSNNFCPPKITQTTETRTDPETGAEMQVTVNTRSGANIHISETVFSVPDSYKVTVVDSRDETVNGNPDDVEGPTIDIADFPFLAEGGAVSAVETENGANVFANNSLWWVRLDQPWTTADETSPLEVGFSTALLNEADWFRDDNKDGVSDGDPVQFRFDAVHVLQDGTPQEAHVLGAHLFAFEQREADTAMEHPQWSNVKTVTENTIGMATGQYRPMQLVFTKPGQYLVQVNVEGYVRETAPSGASEDWSRISPDTSISSPVQWYTFHVGTEADLHTQVNAASPTYSEGSPVVPITVTAANDGPNGVEDIAVEINLPAGLNAPATLPDGATSNGCGVIVWDVGAMSSGASRVLSFLGYVDPGTVGSLTVTAEIRSTIFDPNPVNNAASGVTAISSNVRPPFFPGVTRDIVEHAIAGTHAGDPVAAVSPDGRSLHYSLSGRCSDLFRAHSNGQIVLAAGQTLDYQQQWEYPLTLHVSDHVNSADNADTSVDDSIPVLIRVEDTEPGAVHPTVTFSRHNPTPQSQTDLDLNHPIIDQWLELRTELHDLPSGVEPTYRWYVNGGHDPNAHGNNYLDSQTDPGTITYTVHVKWPGGGITASYAVEWFRE